MMLDQQQIDQFKDRGFTIVPDLLSGGELAAMVLVAYLLVLLLPIQKVRSSKPCLIINQEKWDKCPKFI